MECNNYTMSIIAKLLLVAQLFFSVSHSQYCRGIGQKNTDSESDVKTIEFLLMVPYPDPLNRSSFAFHYDFEGHQMTPIANLARNLHP